MAAEQKSLQRRKRIRIHKMCFGQYTVSIGTAFYAGETQYGAEKDTAQRKNSSPVRAFMPWDGRPDRKAIFSYDLQSRRIQLHGDGAPPERADAEGGQRQDFRQKRDGDCR